MKMAVNLEGSIYSCKQCGTHLAVAEDIFSEAFNCPNGLAYLCNKIVNITAGESRQQQMVTGICTVVNISCVGCHSIVGWKYEAVDDKSQEFKVGKFLLDRFMARGPNGKLYEKNQEGFSEGNSSLISIEGQSKPVLNRKYHESALVSVTGEEKKPMEMVVNLEGSIYMCKQCDTHLAVAEDILYKTFHCSNGPAYLLDKIVNITTGKSRQQQMVTGMSTVVDISCVGCHSIVGWKYEAVDVESQEFKVGKFLLDMFMACGPDDKLDEKNHEKFCEEKSSLISIELQRDHIQKRKRDGSAMVSVAVEEKKQMEMVNLEGSIYSCKQCDTHLAVAEDIFSQTFNCPNGLAYLFNKIVNINAEKSRLLQMVTGRSTVVNISCVGCHSIVGWKYEAVDDESQEFKVGKFLLDRFMVRGPNGKLYEKNQEGFSEGIDGLSALRLL